MSLEELTKITEILGNLGETTLYGFLIYLGYSLLKALGGYLALAFIVSGAYRLLRELLGLFRVHDANIRDEPDNDRAWQK